MANKTARIAGIVRWIQFFWIIIVCVQFYLISIANDTLDDLEYRIKMIEENTPDIIKNISNVLESITD